MALRAVFDTNVVISALLFETGHTAWLRAVWARGEMIPLVNQATVSELLRVLAYPKFRLSRDEREELLGDFLPYAETVSNQNSQTVPQSRDPHDQMFLELAASGKADYLVTGDADLLALRDEFGIPILTPGELRASM